ncbi:alpha/beta hydrolase [Algoriphagus sp.]|uniref:alpha/beta fold hydrolase n=1 Tax=Algoriphagus sp. TaxID=1872435 RepID=UPI0025F15402|nr:alpha/beta hydrolase [Algoriphagus sp.]
MKKALLLFYFTLGIASLVFAQNSISIESFGKGDPILFLPGFATPGEVWKENASQFPDNNSLLVTYAGFGQVAPVEMPWFGKLKTDLIKYINEKNLRQITVVGHSMGGNLALELAAALPDHIQRIIIVDALSCMREIMMPGVSADALGYESPYNDQLLAMDETAKSNYLDQMTQNMITQPDEQRKVKSWMESADHKTFVYGYVDLLKLDSRPLLPTIKQPTLIYVAGQPFGVGALETMKKQYEDLENKEFVFAAESKHYIMLDQKDWFNQQLKTFITK